MNLKEVREKAKLSQAAFAKTIGVSSSAVASVEAGRMKTSQKIIDKVKEVYGEVIEPEVKKVQAAEKKVEEKIEAVEKKAEAVVNGAIETKEQAEKKVAETKEKVAETKEKVAETKAKAAKAKAKAVETTTKAKAVAAKAEKNLPSCIVCDCVKGKGLSFMERNNAWHKGVPTDEQFAIADNRSLDRMYRDIAVEGLKPVLNDYLYV